MADREALIEILTEAVAARAGSSESLALPDWDKVTWGHVLARADLRELNDGDILIEKDDAGRSLFFLVEGSLEVSISHNAMHAVSPIARIDAGSVVGEVAFLDSSARSASVWARGHAVLFRLDRPGFNAFRREHPEIACDLVLAIGRILAQRIRRSQDPKIVKKGLFGY